MQGKRPGPAARRRRFCRRRHGRFAAPSLSPEYPHGVVVEDGLLLLPGEGGVLCDGGDEVGITELA